MVSSAENSAIEFPVRSFFRILMEYKRLILFSIIILVCSSNLNAQTNIKFERGIIDLPPQKETNIVRDHDGFLWFGYWGGLARYDGKEVKYYLPGSNSISGPGITALAVDQDGDIWISTNKNGLNRYSKNTDTFTHYKHDPDPSKNSISSNTSEGPCAQRLFVSQTGKILIGTLVGLDIYDNKTGKFTHHKPYPADPEYPNKNNVNAVIEDKNGIIWVGTSSGGLNKFNPKTDLWTHYRHQPDDSFSISGNNVWSLLEDRDGEIWAGTWQSGLNRLNKKTGKFIRYQAPDSMAENRVNFLYQDKAGYIWISHQISKHAALEVFNKKTGKFTRYRHDPKNSYSISSNSISTVFEDPVTEIIWFVNNFGAIDKFDKRSRKFQLYQHDPNDPNSLGIQSSLVAEIFEDHKKNLWVSTMGSLDRFDKKTDKFVHHKLSEIDKKLGIVFITIFVDSSNDFWALDIKGNLVKLDTEKMELLEIYSPDVNDNNSIMVSTEKGSQIIEDKDNKDLLWITLSSGLEQFNKKEKKFTHYVHNPDNPKSIVKGTIWTVYDDGKGFLWVSGFSGLCKLNKKKNHFTHYVPSKKEPDKSIGFVQQSKVFEDSFGNFWITGFQNGMDKFDKKTGVFKHFNRGTGFPVSGINKTIHEDKSGHLWIASTDNGLIKFNIKDEKILTVYSVSDGLQSNNFWRSHQAIDGKLWFGGAFGLNSFDPQKLKDNPYIPPIVLTSLKQSGKAIKLKKAVEKTKEISLDWKTNFFEFTFAALNYTKPEKNQYAYKLEGRDKDWNFCGTTPRGIYTGLNGGRYTLHLKGSNNDGIWNEKGTSIKIIVTPPFWKATWFYLLAICLLFIMIGFVFVYLMKLRSEISDRKQAETELSESEKKYRDLIDSAPDLRYRTDMEGRIVFASQSVFGLSGYTVEEAIGMKMAEEIYINPEERENFLQMLQKNGIIIDFEAQLKHKNGSIWWASTNAKFSKDTAGNIIGVEGVTRDITKRKLTEEKLSLQSGIITRMSEGVFMVNEDSIIVYTNPAFERMFGYDSDEMIGFHVSNLNAPTEKSSEETAEEILKILNNTGKWIGEIQNIKKDGTTFWSSANVTILDHQKYGKAFISVQTDISELKQTKDEKKELENKLQQAQKMESIGNLAGGIAHDFNNLLFPIIGMSEMLLEDLPEDSLEYENAEEIFQAGKRAGDLVKQILAFSRQSEHKMSPVRVQNVLKEVLKLSRSTIPTNIEIQQNIQQDCGLVMADPTQIHQIGMNLITNAFHAIEGKNGTIDIELKEIILKDNELSGRDLQPGQYIKLSVSDNGIGMSEDTILKIFEPYYTTKEQGKGTGLGLAVLYGIVKEHKGEINVYSELGKGTAFNVYLPIMKKLSEVTAVDKMVKVETGIERILLVDDEISVAKLEGQMLSRLGYRVTVKTESNDALNTFKANPNSFDLVISDMTMPGMTGDQLTKKIISIKPGIPIIICTGFSERINKDQAKMLGVKGFLMKPVIKSDMAQMVRNVLDESKIS